jgi:hypothetical protein
MKAVRERPNHLQVIVGAKPKPVSKAYRDNWNAIYAKKKKR